jgi:hypothetical protein
VTIDGLLARYEPELRRAFMAGVSEITNSAQINRIAEALERGDIQRAIDELAIDRAAYREFEDTLAQAYSDGGAAALDELGVVRDQEGRLFRIRFNARDLEAERVIREHSSEFVTRIVDDQREAIRQAMQERLSEGVNPRTTALDIVGRIDKGTQRRSGGIVGLSAPQERYVSNARRELSEGDYAAYFTRQRRDKRFDALIRRAERDGKPLTRDQVSRIVGRYSDRLLKLRGETIARTETLTSLRAAQYEAARQLVASGKVRREDVRLVWKATFDGRTRDSHAILHGESTGIDEPFVSPLTGARIRYPGDPSAPAEEIINCRCALTVRVDYGANLRRNG